MNRRGFLRAAGAAGVAALVGACGEAGGGGSAAGSSTSAPAGAAGSGAPRVVIAGGAIAEIAFALGAGGAVVGVDTSCTFPEEAMSKLPKVGYQRKLSAEGVLSLRPTVLLASDEAGPPEALAQIEGAGVRVVRFEAVKTVDAAVMRVRAVGAALGRGADAERLADELVRDVTAARAELGGTAARPRALFIFSRGPGLAMVGGKGTPAAAMIDLAGGVNAADELDGFQAISAESVIAAKPDVVVISEKGLASLGGEAGLFTLPGLAATPAAQGKRVAAIDDALLLGFGPRLGEALRLLGKGLRATSVGR